MTPKLMVRLDRLERSHAEAEAAQEMPKELAQIWLVAVAHALGGYEGRPEPGQPSAQDSIGDGFARALGYGGRDDMAVRSSADPVDWRERMARVEAAMDERYGAIGLPPGERVFSRMRGALDDVARMRRAGFDLGPAELALDDLSL